MSAQNVITRQERAAQEEKERSTKKETKKEKAPKKEEEKKEKENKLKDVVSRLGDHWWRGANIVRNEENKGWKSWKSRYGLVQGFQEAFYFCAGYRNTIVIGDYRDCDAYRSFAAKKYPTKIADHAKAQELMYILTSFMLETPHQNTQLAILKLLPCLINSFSVESIKPNQYNIIEAICTKHWTYSKQQFFHPLCTDVLVQLWQKTEIPLNDEKFKTFLRNALADNRATVRSSALKFLYHCALHANAAKSVPLIRGYIREFEHLRDQQRTNYFIPSSIIMVCGFFYDVFGSFISFISGTEIAELIGNLALNNKYKDVRYMGCKCLYSIIALESDELIHKKIMNVWKDISQEKRANNNIQTAQIEYMRDMEPYTKNVQKSETEIKTHTDSESETAFLNNDPLDGLDEHWWQKLHVMKPSIAIQVVIEHLATHSTIELTRIQSLPIRFGYNVHTKQLLNLFADYLEDMRLKNDSYITERKVNLLKLIICFGFSYGANIWLYRKCGLRIIQLLMCDQWKRHKKSTYLALVTHALISLAVYSGLDLFDVNDDIMQCMHSRHTQLNILCFDFLSKLCIISTMKEDTDYYRSPDMKQLNKISAFIEKFIQHNDEKLINVLKKTMTKSKDKTVRDNCAKFISCAKSICWESTLDSLYKQLQNNKSAKQSFDDSAQLIKKEKNRLANNNFIIPKFVNRKRSSSLQSQLDLRNIAKRYSSNAANTDSASEDLLDPVAKLKKEWWDEVSQISENSPLSKRKYEAIKILFEYCAGNYQYEIGSISVRNRYVKAPNLAKQIKHNKHIKDILNMMEAWILNPKTYHIPTKRLIFKLMVPFSKSVKKYQFNTVLVKHMILKEWKTNCVSFGCIVTDALLAIYCNSAKIKLKQWEAHVLKAINSKHTELRENAFDFLSKLCAMNDVNASTKISTDIEEFIQHINTKELLKTILNDRASVRYNAAKFLYAALKICWNSKPFDKVYKKVSKRAIHILSKASELYQNDKSYLNEQLSNGIQTAVNPITPSMSHENRTRSYEIELDSLVFGYCRAMIKKSTYDILPIDVVNVCLSYAQTNTSIFTVAIGRGGIFLNGAMYDLLSKESANDKTYFKLNENKHTARCLLADSDPSIFEHNTWNFMDINNIAAGSARSGSIKNSNFARGQYTTGAKIWNTYTESMHFERIRKDLESNDVPQGIQFMHSLGGGTGSGMCSLMMRSFKTYFPKLVTSSFTIFPSVQVSDSAMEPFNAVLALSEMVNVCDCTFVIDNQSLFDITTAYGFGYGYRQTYAECNFVASQMINDINSLFRCNDSYGFNVSSFVNTMIKYPKLKFLTSSRAPFYDKNGNILAEDKVDATDSYALVNKLFDKRRLYSDCNIMDGSSLSTVILNRGVCAANKYIAGSIKSTQAKLCKTVHFEDDIIFTQIDNKGICKNDMNLAMITNNTAVTNVFERLCTRFDLYYKKRVMVHHYLEHGLEFDELTHARSVVRDLIADYNESV